MAVYDEQLAREAEQAAREEWAWHEWNARGQPPEYPVEEDRPELSSFEEWTRYMDVWYEEQEKRCGYCGGRVIDPYPEECWPFCETCGGT